MDSNIVIRHLWKGEKLRIAAYNGDIEIGFAYLHVGDSFIEADDGNTDDINPDQIFWVHPEHRRHGVATSIYNYAEDITKKPIIPSESRSGDGDEFWRHRLKTLPTEHPAHEWY